MDEYRKDIEEIKELLKKIQKDIAQLEIKIEAEPTAEPYSFTIPEPVPSTQATSATTMYEPIRSLADPPPECFVPSTQATDLSTVKR